MPSTDSIPVIDMWAPIVPTAEIMADFAGFPEPMLGYLRHQVIYGTGAFLLGRRPADLLSEMRALPIRPGILEKWLWRNAAVLMGGDAGPSLGS